MKFFNKMCNFNLNLFEISEELLHNEKVLFSLRIKIENKTLERKGNVKQIDLSQLIEKQFLETNYCEKLY